MAPKLVELGVDIFEAGFPIASDGDFEAVDAVAANSLGSSRRARPRQHAGYRTRRAALKNAKRPRIHTFIATSDIHLKYKLKKSRQQVLDEAVAAVRSRASYTDDVEFSAEDATRTDWDYLEQISHAVVAAGARTVNLPDTVGYSVPEEYAALIGRMVEALGNTRHRQRPLPRRSWTRRRQLHRRRPGGRAPDRVHHQRHRRTRRQRRPRRNRDGDQNPSR